MGSYKDRKEFVDKIVEASNIISKRQIANNNVFYDGFGRKFRYRNYEELEKILNAIIKEKKEEYDKIEENINK